MRQAIVAALLAVSLFGGFSTATLIARQARADGLAAVDAGAIELDSLGGGKTAAVAGPASSPALASVDIADPLESPADFWTDVKEAQKTGWPALVVVILFAAFRLARGRIAWFRDGARAAYSAGALTILAALVDWLAGGGTWVAAAAAALAALALLLNPTPSAKPGPVADDNVKFPK